MGATADRAWAVAASIRAAAKPVKIGGTTFPRLAITSAVEEDAICRPMPLNSIFSEDT
jgi:hypothetical protein